MEFELEHDGRIATKCKLNGNDFGMYVEEINIKIEGGCRPEITIKGRLNELKSIIENCDIKIEGDDDLSIK